jgi:hypothetical protein
MPLKKFIAMVLLGATAATAQTASVGPKSIPGETREQKLFYVQDQLRKMDVNGDKKLSEAEWMAAGGTKAGFDTLDTNRDSVLTIQELRSNARKLKAFEDFKAAAPH